MQPQASGCMPFWQLYQEKKKTLLNELNLTWPRGNPQLYYKPLEEKNRLRSIGNGPKESVETAGSNNRKLGSKLDKSSCEKER